MFFSDTLVSAISKADWTDIYRITAVMKAKIYIIASFAASLIMYIEILKVDVIILLVTS